MGQSQRTGLEPSGLGLGVLCPQASGQQPGVAMTDRESRLEVDPCSHRALEPGRVPTGSSDTHCFWRTQICGRGDCFEDELGGERRVGDGGGKEAGSWHPQWDGALPGSPTTGASASSCPTSSCQTAAIGWFPHPRALWPNIELIQAAQTPVGPAVGAGAGGNGVSGPCPIASPTLGQGKHRRG